MTRSMTAQARVRQLVSPPDFFERALQQVRGTQSLAQGERIGQVNREGREIVGETGRGTRVVALEFANERAQAALRILWTRGSVSPECVTALPYSSQWPCDANGW
jgi:hypothetical protein